LAGEPGKRSDDVTPIDAEIEPGLLDVDSPAALGTFVIEYAYAQAAYDSLDILRTECEKIFEMDEATEANLTLHPKIAICYT